MSTATLSRPISWLPLLLLCLVTVAVFWVPLVSDHVLYSADYAPYYSKDHGVRVLQGLWGSWDENGVGVGGSGRAFHPSKVLAMLLPPLVYHVAVYIIDTLLVFLAALYFLRGRGLHGLSAFLASLALAYSGYLFTLISAGHRSMFDMMPYALFLFGLLDRGIERRSLFHFAMVGVCGAFGLMAQPDVMGLMVVLAGVYALLRFVWAWPADGVWKPYLVRVSLGAALAVLAFLPFSFSVLGHIFAEVVPGRDVARGTAKTDQWEFATNWSLPPEEVVEFVAPGVFGLETGSPRGPYWGRVGRTLGWEDTRRGLMNLKQHTVYMGVLQLIFGVYAVFWAVRTRRRHNGQAAQAGTVDALSERGANPAFGVGEVWFFVAVFVIGLLLAFGRYSPIYRIFYAIPFCDKIRAPIKFLHYSEIALAFLFARGFQSFVDDLGRSIVPLKRRFTGFLVASLAMVMVLLLAAALLHSIKPGLESYWRQLGFGRYTGVMFEAMRAGLMQGGALFIVAAVVFAVGRFMQNRRHAAFWATSIVAVALVVDLAVVGRKYVHVRDLSTRYARNPIAEHVVAKGPCRVSYRIPQQDRYGDFKGNFYHCGIDFLEPQSGKPVPQETRRFLDAISSDALRLWQLTNTRFILAPAAEAAPLKKHSAFSVVDSFDISGGTIASRGAAGRGAYTLVECRAALPKAVFFPDWEGVNESDVWTRLQSRDWNPAAKVLVEGPNDPSPTGDSPSIPDIETYRRTCVAVNVHAVTDGVLLINDAYHKDWGVSVDGEPSTVLRCNGVMRGVQVPAGQHHVVFRYCPYWWRFIAAMAACAVMLIWAGWRGLRAIGRQRSVASG